jgi:hypothetical protein
MLGVTQEQGEREPHRRKRRGRITQEKGRRGEDHTGETGERENFWRESHRRTGRRENC